MLSREKCRELMDLVLRSSEADETEILVGDGAHALTRFANNTIHQNVAEEGCHLSVRTVFEGCTARASTNKLDPDSVRRVVAASSSLARSRRPDPNLLPMTGPQEYREVGRYWEATASTGPMERARRARSAIETAERHGLTAAGIFSTGESVQALLNSRGLFAYYPETHSEFSITMLDRNSSGWAKANSPNVADLDSDALAERAAGKAIQSRDPVEAPPGRYTVILEPSAVLDLAGFLFYDFGGLSVLDQRSFLTGRLGNKLFGENITIRDDAGHPLQSGAPFDGEGMARRPVLLVDHGVVKNLVYARQTARKAGAEPTGHGFPLPNEMGEAPMNLVIEGGPATIEEMIATTERGILVTRLWYIREVEPYSKMLTGMTRDGTFLVENGKVTRGVRNFRFNQSVVEMLNQVETLGVAERTAGEESFEMVVPPMKVRNFHFTEVTKF